MPFVQRVARAGRVAAWVVSIALVTACGGGGPKGNDYVDYDGPTLVVEGTPYKRETSFDPPGTTLPGRVVVQLRDGHVDEVLALLERYGLTLEGRSAEGWLLLKTPERFEEQWARALSAQLGGRGITSVDSARSPTALATAEPAGDSDAVAGEPVPDHAPSADDVQRAFLEMYDRIEEAGGLPFTVTSSGKAIVIHAKIFDVRDESCEQTPRAKPGEWSCEAELMMAVCTGDCDPSSEERLPKAERISIRWDPAKGEFGLGNYGAFVKP